MNEDERDKTIFVEYYPSFVLTSVWNNNGTLDRYHVAGMKHATC